LPAERRLRDAKLFRGASEIQFGSHSCEVA